MSNRHQRPPAPWASIIKVNSAALTAFCFGFIAWLLWPDSTRWWQAGMLAILIGAAAFASALLSLKEMLRILKRAVQLGGYLKKGRAPRSHGLQSDKALRSKGLLQ